MFDKTPHRRSPIDPVALAKVAERARPVSASQTQLLPVIPPLVELLPERGLRRGSTVMIDADQAGGATTLALALVAAASASGSWCVAIGLPDIGALAAGELNLDLTRLAFVPWPDVRFAQTAATLIEGVDVVLLRPPLHVRPHLVRRLVARLRDRRAVLVVLASASVWPERCDVELRVQTARWVAVGPGDDCLRKRLATVTVTGRRSADRPRRHQLWLPAESGWVESA
jgi:hypothetical protein